MAGSGKRKAMHINLSGAQVADYKLVKEYTGITNDNDLVRYLFRQRANEIRRGTGSLKKSGGSSQDESG